MYTPQRFNRFTLGFAAYFAPDVLSMGDSERYQDYTLRFAYNVMRQADIYVGARYIRGDYKKAPDAYYDTGMHVGHDVAILSWRVSFIIEVWDPEPECVERITAGQDDRQRGMAGHSKWANIQHRKGAQDKKRVPSCLRS